MQKQTLIVLQSCKDNEVQMQKTNTYYTAVLWRQLNSNAQDKHSLLQQLCSNNHSDTSCKLLAVAISCEISQISPEPQVLHSTKQITLNDRKLIIEMQNVCILLVAHGWTNKHTASSSVRSENWGIWVTINNTLIQKQWRSRSTRTNHFFYKRKINNLVIAKFLLRFCKELGIVVYICGH